MQAGLKSVGTKLTFTIWYCTAFKLDGQGLVSQIPLSFESVQNRVFARTSKLMLIGVEGLGQPDDQRLARVQAEIQVLVLDPGNISEVHSYLCGQGPLVESLGLPQFPYFLPEGRHGPDRAGGGTGAVSL